jgi:hypothetical protein
VLGLGVPACLPRPVRQSVPPLPSSGSRLAPVPHLRRYYEGRTTPPGPSRPSPVSLDGAVPLRWMHVRSPGQGIHPSRGRALCGQACHACSHAGGDGRPPRFLGNPCESVPRARDSGGSQRPRHIGRPDAVFRQANGVDIRNGIRFRSCTLAARFLAAYASPRQLPDERQGSLPACPLRRWPGWTLTSWIPSRGFGQLMCDFLLSQAWPGAIAWISTEGNLPNINSPLRG